MLSTVLPSCAGLPFPCGDDIICFPLYNQCLRGIAFTTGIIEHANLLRYIVRSLLLDILHGEKEDDGKQFVTSQYNGGVLCKIARGATN